MSSFQLGLKTARGKRSVILLAQHELESMAFLPQLITLLLPPFGFSAAQVTRVGLVAHRRTERAFFAQ